MTKQVTKPKAEKKPITKKTKSESKTKETKPPFDMFAPIFKTKMIWVYKWLDYMDETYNDPNDEWLSWDEYMVWAPWLRDVEFYKSNNIPWTLLSCHERIQMGIYDPITKKSKDDGDKP